MSNTSKMTVLLIDDEICIRQSFSDYFEDRLWKTIQAESGEQALEFLEKESPDGAVVDIRMGGMDGNTFIREACKIKPNMAFVICTGSPEYYVPADLQELLSVSSVLFRKPVNNLEELEIELLQLISIINDKKGKLEKIL